MERKIGEVFEYQGRKLKVVEAVDTCKGCLFIDEDCNCEDLYSAVGACSAISRTDKKPVIIVESEQPAPQEEQKLNLCEILKDCPKGTKFYSPIFGDVRFERFAENYTEIIVISDINTEELIHSDGTITFWNRTSVEPMLFPDRDQRDWSKWKCPKPKFDPKNLKPFDRVLVRDALIWECSFFNRQLINPYPNRIGRTLTATGGSYSYCIPYNEDTKHLVGTTVEAPEYYRYWED